MTEHAYARDGKYSQAEVKDVPHRSEHRLSHLRRSKHYKHPRRSPENSSDVECHGRKERNATGWPWRISTRFSVSSTASARAREKDSAAQTSSRRGQIVL